jgi:hypothetical protein
MEKFSFLGFCGVVKIILILLGMINVEENYCKRLGQLYNSVHLNIIIKYKFIVIVVGK